MLESVRGTMTQPHNNNLSHSYGLMNAMKVVATPLNGSNTVLPLTVRLNRIVKDQEPPNKNREV